MAKSYSAEDIKILEGLDAVRLRPGMYIGSTGVKGLHHILWEIVDNAIDEASNGYATRIEVKLYKDGSASVEDNGRGIPTDIHPKTGVSGVEVVFTQLHAGGKFDEHNYSFSGGLHGVGASVTNALSEWLKVEVYRKTVFKMSFHSYYDEKAEKYMSGVPDEHLTDTKEKTEKTGTFIRFKPDASVFDTVNFNFDTVSKRLKELAFLNKGLEINLIDERVPDDKKPIVVNYKFDGGLHDFAMYLNEGKTPLYDNPIGYKTEKDGILIEFAVQHTSDFTESLFSFVNNIPTPEGGFHETGFRTGLTKSLNDIARSMGALKDKDQNLLGEDFREGLTAILSIKMKNVQFEGQTKTKLGNAEARQPVETATVEGMAALYKDPKLKSTFDEIIKKAQAAARVRIAARQAKEVARAKNSIENLTLVGKLAACTGKKPELNELFIVEGDSAGGTAKQARIRLTQAILPLRGKPLNVEKKRIDQVLANEEIRTIISALGAGYGSDFVMDDLKYHKVIILSDADQDGMHIRCILLTFFFRYMRELINNGNVYIGMPPLYKVYKKDVVEYAYDDEELQKKIEIVGKGYQIQRYKGLGEMSAEQLWETTMDPARRNLIQVNIEDAAEAEQMVTALMGDRVEARKEFLAQNANFNKVDTFIDRVNI
ncbi:MAG TPA: DNA gyrase subunit B [Candidatus Borkfalkia excrementigallinarum]|uniref:DNA topoisomerase (ATP-hydrolyzing) n=1 Tax=Candidatus Borkfalkia excrementigallinarum TaxID=2838506 RepID=A0A9D2A0M9_9FIRM|nr:DNA gyrase subunit B [Candidatus Borkfalkia excrementigallinarum]